MDSKGKQEEDATLNPAKQQTRWSDRIASATWFLVFLASFLIAAELISWMVAAATGIVLLCSYLLIRKTSAPFDLRRLTISSFWYASYLAMIFFPAFFVFADQDGSNRVRYLFAVESVLITVPLGALCASRFLSFRSAETSAYFDGRMQSPQVPDSFGKKFAILVGVALLFTGLYVRDVGTIPVFSLLKNIGDEPFLAQLREDSFKLLNSPLEYFYFLTRGTLYPLLIAVSFGCYLWARSRKWLVFFLGTLFAGILFASFSLAKKPVATIFLVMGLFTYFYRNIVGSRHELF